MITIGARVWVEAAFLDSVGEAITLAMEPHTVVDVSAADVLLNSLPVWIPKTACHLEKPK